MTQREIAATLASLLLASCASAPGRNPAGDGPGVPYVPGGNSYDGGSSSGSSASHSSGSSTTRDPNSPADDSKSDSTPSSTSTSGTGPRDSYGYVNPRDPNWKGPNNNTFPQQPNDQSQVNWPQQPQNGGQPDPNVCNIRFDKVPAGSVPIDQGGLSVQDLIWHASQYGTTNQDWSRDQQIFAGYLSYTATGSMVQQAAMYSGPFQQALLAAQSSQGQYQNQYQNQGQYQYQNQYQNQNPYRGPNQYPTQYQNQYQGQYQNQYPNQNQGQGQSNAYGMKMAAIISAMIATKQDPACTMWIRNHAPNVLGPWAADLDLLPFVAAAEFSRSKVGANGATRLETEFKSVEQRIEDESRKSKAIDRKVDSLKKQNDARLKSLDADVTRQVKSLKTDLKQITECHIGSTGSLQDYSDDQEQQDALASVDECKDKLKGKIADYDIEIKDYQARIDAAQAHQKTADVERFTARKALIEERKTQANADLTKLNSGLVSVKDLEKAVKVRDALKEEIKSGMKTTDDAGQPVAPTPTEVAKALQDQARAEQAVKALYPQYLTYGYMGGYPWTQQYNQQHLRAWGQAMQQMQQPVMQQQTQYQQLQMPNMQLQQRYPGGMQQQPYQQMQPGMMQQQPYQQMQPGMMQQQPYQQMQPGMMQQQQYPGMQQQYPGMQQPYMQQSPYMQQQQQYPQQQPYMQQQQGYPGTYYRR